MAYTKTNWLARTGTGLNKYKDTNDNNRILALVHSPDSITQQGTPLSAENLNKMEQGIYDAHVTADGAVQKSGGELKDTVTTFSEATGTRSNIASGEKTSTIFGKIKQWFSALKALAFKDKVAAGDYTAGSIVNADISSSAAIAQSKISGLTTDLSSKVTASGGEVGNTVATFTEATGTRSNIATGESVKTIFGKIKQWFSALGSLAFKSSVSDSDVASNAAIAYSKLSGVASSTHTHGNITNDGKVGTVADKLLCTGTGGTIGAKTVAELKTLFLDITHPVGSIFMSATLSTASAVATALGGTWVAWGAGRVPIGVDTSDTDFNAAEKTGGEKTHKLVTSEIPSHSHNIQATDDAGNNYGNFSKIKYVHKDTAMTTEEWWSTKSTGGGDAHNNLQPYITCYMYKRTA